MVRSWDEATYWLEARKAAVRLCVNSVSATRED